MLLNIIGFNIIWLGLISMGNIFIPLALIFLGAHLSMMTKFKNEWLLILVIAIIGICIDSFLHVIQLFNFPESRHIPFWLMVLWVCFATTICHSLQFLDSSKLFQIVVGGVFAPLSYLAGAKLNAVELGLPVAQTYFVLSMIWALLFILFFHLKSKIVIPEVNHA